MNPIISYFSHVPDSHRIYLLGACLALFGSLESIFSFKKGEQRTRHILTNSLFMIPAAPIQLAIGFLLLAVIRFVEHKNFGLLNNLPFRLNPFFYGLACFVLLDLCEYIYHIVMHKVKRLWMFHLVHHSDRQLTVSTTLREHPVETGIRLLFLVLWVALIGVSFWALLLRQFIQIVSNVFVHANVRVNEQADKLLSFLFVTPNMHQVHHHFERPYTDTNYGDVLSVWDRLFGTFRSAGGKELEFGVDSFYDRQETGRFSKLLQFPFGKYQSPSN